MKATPFSAICHMAMMHFMRKQVDDTDRCPANDVDFDTIWNESPEYSMLHIYFPGVSIPKPSIVILNTRKCSY